MNEFCHTLLCLSLLAASSPCSGETNERLTPLHPDSRSIPWSEIGTKAAANYQGDGLSVSSTATGARLHCLFQRLDGEVTSEGLSLTSTVASSEKNSFRVVATRLGREPSFVEDQIASLVFTNHSKRAYSGLYNGETLSKTGIVSVIGQTVHFSRPGLDEEYHVSVDGLQQDFVVLERPASEPQDRSELVLELKVTGAQVEPAASGAQLVLHNSQRKIAYSRLRVTDAIGKELSARMEVRSTGDQATGLQSEIRNQQSHIAVVVNDAAAVYPVRIDPTFSDANWISLGGIPGAYGTVFAAVLDVSGNLYIGGAFGLVGDVIANHIAKWNGSAWTALGSGVDSYVLALAVSGGDVYAGGYFAYATNSGGATVRANYIAKWNGSVWSALGSGMDSVVYALAASGSNLYAGGSFTYATNTGPTAVLVNSIAKWDGNTWSTLGSGMNSSAYALAMSGSDVYAGGYFTYATNGGGAAVAANRIARWNGSAWSPLGAGMNDQVNAMVFTGGGDLYAGGSFTIAGATSANRVAKWNGSAWIALGSGVNSSVSALAVSGSNVYAGGAFTNAGGGAANYVAKWNGSTWSALASGAGGAYPPGVYALAALGNDVYVGGNFTMAGGSAANYIAKWSGSAWSPLGSGLGGGNVSVAALAVSGSDLYAGGSFIAAAGNAANYIARWDGGIWSGLGLGMNNWVRALAMSGSDLYAGGFFTAATNSNGMTVPVNYIAKWNGITWSALGLGMDAPVSAVVVSGSNLYAGGDFTYATNSGSVAVAANRIAMWNGSAWTALGSGVNSSVYALAISGGNLYAGGNFTAAGGSAANYVAMWNGNVWSALGSGMGAGSGPTVSGVFALAVSGTDVYAGGNFTTAGGNAANYIAKWNGSAWSRLGFGMADGIYPGTYVSALALSGNDLYAAGDFKSVDGYAANFIAKWNGSVWNALGSGVSDTVGALAVSSGALYVGGGFMVAGGKVSAYAAAAAILPLRLTVTSNGSGTVTKLPNQFSYESNALVTLTATPGSGWGFSGWSGDASGASNPLSVTMTNDKSVTANFLRLPSITLQPQSQTDPQGFNAYFSVSATATNPLSYQWRLNGTNIPGATSAAYTRTNLQPADAGQYSVLVSNAVGTTVSSNAMLTVVPASSLITLWTFNSPAQDTNINTGSLSPSVGSGVASWVGGTTNFNTAPFGGSLVDTNVSDNSAWWTANYPPQGTSNKTAGVRFDVSTGGRQNIGVRWDQFSAPAAASKYTRLQYSTNGVDFADFPTASSTPSTAFAPEFGDLSGVGGVNNNTNFAVRIVAEFESTAAGTTNANYVTPIGGPYDASLPIAFDMVAVYGDLIPPPTITSQPTNQIVAQGSNATFSVAANGFAPLSYQWRFKGTNLAGATGSNFTRANAQAADAGNYNVVVSNPGGSVTSAVAVLTVVLPPAIALGPQSIPQGFNAYFEPTYISGGSPDGYQWRFNGTNIAGATDSYYTRAHISPADAGVYSVIVSNLGGVSSSSATISVILPSSVIALWDFNSPSPDTNYSTGTLSPAVGSGTASYTGGTSNHSTGQFSGGSFSDANVSDNTSWFTGGYPAQGTSNKTAGVRFDVSTRGRRNIGVRWDYFMPGPASKYARLQYSTNGTVFTDFPAAVTGIAWTPLVNDLSGFVGVNNNSSFGFRIVTEFESTAAGTTNANYVAVSGGGFQYIPGAPMGFDVVTVFGDSIPAPVITLDAPVSGTMVSPATLPLRATAGDPEGYVSRVDFYVSGSTNGLLASLTNSQPLTNSYQAAWSGVPPGNYAITAVAINNSGIASTSAPVAISVIPAILVNGAYSSTHTFSFLATNQITVSMNPLPGGHILYTLGGDDLSGNVHPYEAPFSVTNSILIRAWITDSGFSPLQEVDSVLIVTIPLYTLTPSTPGGGSIIISNCCGPYPSNSPVTLTAIASTNWSFLGWAGDAFGSSSNLVVIMDTNKSIRAIFGTALDVRTNANGTILTTPSTNLYPYGSTVRLTAVANPQFHFQQWQDAAIFGASQSPLNFAVTSAIPTISAIFLPNSANFFTLNVEIGTGDGTVTRVPFATQYTNLTTVSLTSSPAPGQLFLNWTNNGLPGPSTSNLTVVMTNNKTVVANFSAPFPPYIAITSPTNGATFGYQAPINVSVNSTSAVGSVVQVAFYSGGSSGTLLGTVTNPPFTFTWTNAPAGTNVLLTAVASDNFGLASAAVVPLTIVLPPPGPPVFSLSASSYFVSETNGSVIVTVLKSFNSYTGAVNYFTTDGSAVAVSNVLGTNVLGTNLLGNYFFKSNSLNFLTNETSKEVSILIKDNSPYYVGNRTFTFSLILPDTNAVGTLDTPSSATITIVDVNSNPPVSLTTNFFPSRVPPHTGQLVMYILPSNAGGQWRLLREKFWRESGDIVGKLADGSYEVEFKAVPGFLPPENITVPVSDGILNPWTNQYPLALTPTPTGPLTITLQPPAVANASDVNHRGQWRLLGQSNWLDSGVTLNNLLAGNYAIECKSVPNYASPPLTNAVVAPNPNNTLALVYSPAPAPSDCSPPEVVPYNLATNARPSLPYLYTGQLLSEAGYGSGCVVKKRVVLTAAHVVFNDVKLSPVPVVKWFFQRYAGQYEPPTQTPRGWYMLSGYAAARTNDPSAGMSSPASQHFDAAALYFYEDAGRGGQSGYLVSDPDNPEWVQSQSLMTLVGYPVQEVEQTSLGQVFSTPIFEYYFTRSPFTNAVFSTPDVCGLPGMSGGPLFVLNQANNTYYAAAIYLGQSDQTIVRTIDEDVADIINKADATAHTGNNNTGGGVLLISSTAGSTRTKAYLQVDIGPQAALDLGGGWRLQGSSNYVHATSLLTYFDAGGQKTLEFSHLDGWNLASSTNVTLILGQTVIVSALYTPEPPVVRFIPGTNGGIGLSGTVNTKYRLERSVTLRTNSWLPVSTNTLNSGFNLVLPWPFPFTNGPGSFYRALWLP